MENFSLYPFFQNNNNKLSINYYENNTFNKEYYNYKEIPNEEDNFQYFFNIKDNSNYDDSTTYNGSLFQMYDPNFERTIPRPENPKINFLLKKRQKPGAKKKEEDNQINNNKKSYTHSKKKFDNILTKIQVGYINFLVDFTNRLIVLLYGRNDLKFRYLDSQVKKHNKSDIRKQQKEGSIGDMLKNEISPKYKTLNANTNFLIYDELKRSGFYDILNILNQKFLFFFDKVYFVNKRQFNLKDFGLNDLEVDLPESIKLYENLSNKNIGDADFEEYKIKMEECVKWHFLGGLEEAEDNKIIIKP